MDDVSGSSRILSTIGSEIMSIMTPVSLCMVVVVLLISIVHSPSASWSLSQIHTAATLIYLESPTDSPLHKLLFSLLNAVVFILLISLVTFLLYLLYLHHFTSFLKHYTRFSSFFVLASLGGSLLLSLIAHFSVPVDVITFIILLLNFSVVGVVSVFSRGVPIVVRQGYAVLLGVIVAAWFTELPEWTTWVLLVALAVYDLVAVLAPRGPLRVLVELAARREEEIPALVYEARPTREGGNRLGNLGLLVAGITMSDDGGNRLGNVRDDGGGDRNRVIELQNVCWGRNENPGDVRGDGGDGVIEVRGRDDNEDEHVVHVNEIELMREGDGHPGETLPLMVGDLREQRERSTDHFDGDNGPTGGEGVSLMQLMNDSGTDGRRRQDGETNVDDDDDDDDDSDNGLMPGIKLGLGDFIFYSVLVGRAAMYDLMTVYACYLAIISGLGCTLILLAVCRKALPALPISIALGVIFYFLTRLLMEPFVVGTATNLMMF